MADENVQEQPAAESGESQVEQPVAEPVNEGGEAPETKADEAQAQPAEEQSEEAARQTSEVPSEEATDNDYQAVDYSQFRDSDQTIPLNEDGTVDPIRFRNQLKQELREEMRFERQEERAWTSVEKKYPQLRGDKEVREILLNQRIANAIQGKETNLTKLADRLYGRINTAKSEGRAQANISTKVQQAASLESATSNTGSNDQDQVYDRIISGDKTAADKLLASWLEDGKI